MREVDYQAERRQHAQARRAAFPESVSPGRARACSRAPPTTPPSTGSTDGSVASTSKAAAALALGRRSRSDHRHRHELALSRVRMSRCRRSWSSCSTRPVLFATFRCAEGSRRGWGMRTALRALHHPRGGRVVPRQTAGVGSREGRALHGTFLGRVIGLPPGWDALDRIRQPGVAARPGRAR